LAKWLATVSSCGTTSPLSSHLIPSINFRAAAAVYDDATSICNTPTTRRPDKRKQRLCCHFSLEADSSNIVDIDHVSPQKELDQVKYQDI